MDDCLRRTISIALSFGAKQVETFMSKTRAISVSFDDNRLRGSEVRNDAGIGIRTVISNGKGASLGSSFTMNFSINALKAAAKAAVAVARVKRPEYPFTSFEANTKRRPEIPRLVDAKVKEVDVPSIINLVSSIIKAANKSQRVRSVRGDVTLSYSRISFRNSLGVKCGYDSTLFQVVVAVAAKWDGSQGFAYDGFVSRYFRAEKAVELAENVADLAISQLKPKPFKTGKIATILGPDALEGLSESILQFALRGDYVHRKQSCMSDRLGKQVADSSFSLFDDGTLPGYVGSKPFDDEGHPVTKKGIVECGILRRYLDDLTTSDQGGRGDGRDGGNALRISSPDLTKKYEMEPQIVPHNLIIKAGTEKLDDVIAQVRKGILVRSLLGSHTANRVTGEFSVVPQMAYMILNGEIRYPISQAVISGNILVMLKGIRSIGRELTHYQSISGDSSFTAPSILVEGLRVTR